MPRKIKWRVTFELQGKNSNDVNAQITPLKSYQLRKIHKFERSNDWAALEKYSLENLEKSSVFYYYAADSALMMDNGQLAIDRYTQFL